MHSPQDFEELSFALTLASINGVKSVLDPLMHYTVQDKILVRVLFGETQRKK